MNTLDVNQQVRLFILTFLAGCEFDCVAGPQELNYLLIVQALNETRI
jgi:hypothetical protein